VSVTSSSTAPSARDRGGVPPRQRADQRLPRGDAIADKEISDHAEVEKIFKELEKADPASGRFTELCDQLIADVKEHVEDEEDNLFLALQRHCNPGELGDLGKKVQSAKDKAPTRPPAPQRPTGRR
jgi:hypothetical protein